MTMTHYKFIAYKTGSTTQNCCKTIARCHHHRQSRIVLAINATIDCIQSQGLVSCNKAYQEINDNTIFGYDSIRATGVEILTIKFQADTVNTIGQHICYFIEWESCCTILGSIAITVNSVVT